MSRFLAFAIVLIVSVLLGNGCNNDSSVSKPIVGKLIGLLTVTESSPEYITLRLTLRNISKDSISIVKPYNNASFFVVKILTDKERDITPYYDVSMPYSPVITPLKPNEVLTLPLPLLLSYLTNMNLKSPLTIKAIYSPSKYYKTKELGVFGGEVISNQVTLKW